MMNSLKTTVFCTAVSISIAAASWASAGASWYSPLFSAVEEGEILNISLEDKEGKRVPTKTFINADDRLMSVQVQSNVDQTALVPEFEVTDGFTVEPEPGQSRDFSEPVTYTLHSKETGQSYEWQVNVFDADTGMIFRGEDFKHWKLRGRGYDREKHYGDYIDKRDGLFFRLDESLEDGSWALFYYENERPIKNVEFKYDQLVDHHRNVSLQILDLASIDSDALAEAEWPETELSNADKLTRWNMNLSETTGLMFSNADFSGDPVEGPIAIKYGGAANNYRINVKKVMFTFE